MSTINGYWGPATATIDWCEGNYEVSFYIAEFWNTISNILLVVFSIYGIKMSIVEKHEFDLTVLFFIVMVVGVGSAFFHGTLQTWAQQLDETPMIYAITQWNFVLWRSKLPGNITYWRVGVWIHNLLFTIIHAILQTVTEFQAYFALWVGLGIVRLYQMYHKEFKDNIVVKRLIKMYNLTYLLACGVWLIDFNLCRQVNTHLPFNFQGHAWWHILCGYAGYLGPATLAYYTSLHESPKIHYKMGILPYVTKSDPKKV